MSGETVNKYGNMLGVIAQVPKVPQSKKHLFDSSGNALWGTIVNINGEMRTVTLLGSSERSTKTLTGNGVFRFSIQNLIKTSPSRVAEVQIYNDSLTPEEEHRLRESNNYKIILETALKYIKLTSSSEAIFEARKSILVNEGNLSRFVFLLASYVESSIPDKVQFLTLPTYDERLIFLKELLAIGIQSTEMKKGLANQISNETEQEFKKMVLRKQIKTLNEKLYGSEEDPVMDYENKIEAKNLPEDAKKCALRELNKLRKSRGFDQDSSVTSNYLDFLLDLPWNDLTTDNLSLQNAREILDADHCGLEQIKKRIIEFLAVKTLLKNTSKGSIICFHGPPGVGKTSLGKSIAAALGRKFERMALGGVRDESEIRGHRKTYVGAMPGSILHALQKAKTKNPVILLDEIDKLTKDNHGDPSSALLEALDPAQNNSFKDHYLNTPFDLSKVFFIATANSLSTIQPALLDRMEVIDLNGYTLYEKAEIAKKHLIPKQLIENGLKDADIKVEISEQMIEAIIKDYTSEAGVRDLERKISSVFRNIAVEFLDKKQSAFIIDKARLTSVLGPPVHRDNYVKIMERPGVAVGMAWTSVGGRVLYIEAGAAYGKGNLEFTGQLGDVMKESVKIAFAWIKANANALGINTLSTINALCSPNGQETGSLLKLESMGSSIFDKLDFHIHFPAGAVPKDGPSAGITIICAIVSLLTGKKFRREMAMTGEISLKGLVLPVGGIKEKVLAAYDKQIKR